jgi:hypothetical protein
MAPKSPYPRQTRYNFRARRPLRTKEKDHPSEELHGDPEAHEQITGRPARPG